MELKIIKNITLYNKHDHITNTDHRIIIHDQISHMKKDVGKFPVFPGFSLNWFSVGGKIEIIK